MTDEELRQALAEEQERTMAAVLEIKAAVHDLRQAFEDHLAAHGAATD